MDKETLNQIEAMVFEARKARQAARNVENDLLRIENSLTNFWHSMAKKGLDDVHP